MLGDAETVPHARTMTWLIVLPFRVLRRDAETDFLAFSLPHWMCSTRWVDRGFLLSTALSNDPWLTPLRSLPGYNTLLQRTRRLEDDAALAFTRMSGPELVR